MKTKAGLWIDHRQAIVVIVSATGEEIKRTQARTGLQEKEITAVGLEHVSAVIKSRTKAGYYPGAGEITVKLLAEKGVVVSWEGRLVGMEGSAKRIDTVATALHAGFSVEEMINLDLGYAPPFSPVWDPVVTAAREVAKKL